MVNGVAFDVDNDDDDDDGGDDDVQLIYFQVSRMHRHTYFVWNGRLRQINTLHARWEKKKK